MILNSGAMGMVWFRAWFCLVNIGNFMTIMVERRISFCRIYTVCCLGIAWHLADI
ncbi:hypothetical protein QBC41DRAFT_308909 [Cercophora samala]|uniref:Uncharacterized protein n=1 Tax=Cercophora samala TaxID=330535 RepID=A0AA39ZNM4_9PEZI|nr:hypothetical protein QBC41DRAFT_308909 [Cercophora samala]